MLDARYNTIKGKFTQAQARIDQSACAVSLAQQEADFDTLHSTLNSNALAYSQAFPQKVGLEAAGNRLLQHVDVLSVVSDIGMVLNNIRLGHIYDNIEATLDGIIGYAATVNTTVWSPTTAYSVGDRVRPTTTNGYYYECTTAGVSAATEPTNWPTAEGATVTDGTVVWTAHASPDCAGYQGLAQQLTNDISTANSSLQVFTDSDSLQGELSTFASYYGLVTTLTLNYAVKTAAENNLLFANENNPDLATLSAEIDSARAAINSGTRPTEAIATAMSNVEVGLGFDTRIQNIQNSVRSNPLYY